MKHFLEMGGYGAFVWPAYVVSALAIGWLILAALQRRRRLNERLKELEGRKDNDAGGPDKAGA